MSTRISLAKAQACLGEDTVIDLEPAEVVAAKVAAGKEGELWVFDMWSGKIRRDDLKYFVAGVVRHPAGHHMCAIVEEPGKPKPETGPRIVGHVIVEVNPRGLVRVRKAKGLNGEILELKPSSLSKGALDASGRQPDAIFEANPQRIDGTIAVYRHNVEFDDTEGMDPAVFLSTSTDGRGICAVAKLF